MSDQTIEQRLDEILEKFGASVSPVATFKGVPNPFVKPENISVAKQSLLQLINEARIDELKLHLSAFGLGHILMTKEDVDTRIAQLTPKEEK